MRPTTISIQTPLAGPLSWWATLPCIQLSDETVAQWILFEHEDQLSLSHQGSELGPLSIDWMEGPIAHRSHPQRVFHEDLIRAIGVAKGYVNIWDWSLGLGKDTWMLVNAGCRVQAFERNPIIYRLVRDAWRRAATHPGRERLTIHFGEPMIDDWVPPDVVYLDPMFPQHKKTAKVRGGMQMLQTLVGADEDMTEWLVRALRSGARRVVVKRPTKGPFIEGARSPSHQICGKSSRFDVYQVA